MKIVMGKEPVQEIVDRKDTDDVTRHRLQVALLAREFAINKLSLPNTKSYTTYYDTGKDFVTWNVVAAPEFSFAPRTWCFPVAGCVSYRGYYDEADAQAYASELADSEGLDVTVGGATAYSTLGWFSDPLLNTMLNRGDTGLAALIFHEMAHQKIYVSDDSKFNESFAGFVERAGLERWLDQYGDPALLSAVDVRKQRQQQFIDLLLEARKNLQAVYESKDSVERKRVRKDEKFEELRRRYEELKASWDGYTGYDNWFSKPLNNARLVSVATYTDFLPAFQVLFLDSDENFEQFYEATNKLAALPFDERRREMQNLAQRAETMLSASSQNQ
jgi:predicted aminopeptidase